MIARSEEKATSCVRTVKPDWFERRCCKETSDGGSGRALWLHGACPTGRVVGARCTSFKIHSAGSIATKRSGAAGIPWMNESFAIRYEGEREFGTEVASHWNEKPKLVF
jgi:hypothetical protein